MIVMEFIPAPLQQTISSFKYDGQLPFYEFPRPFVTPQLTMSRGTMVPPYELIYTLTFRAVVFIPNNSGGTAPPLSLYYWITPDSNNLAVFLQYNKNGPIAPPPYTSFDVVYVESQIPIQQDGPFTLTTYLHDEDPGTSRGTVTTVQSATPIQ